MTPCTFDVKFPRGTQLTFSLLTFATGEDRDIKMLPPGLAPEHLTLASSSASVGSCSRSDPCAGVYIRTTKIVQDIPVVTSIIRPLVEASSSSSSTSTSDPDSSDDYPEIRVNACREKAGDGRLICIVAPNGNRLHNSSNRYLTIERSETSDTQTPSDGLVWNLNPDINAVWVQVIMETIQRMTPDGSPFVVLAQQGGEAINLVIVEKSGSVPRREPSVGGNDRVRCARSEAASSTSPNRRLSEHDARRCITQNRVA
jgi:hypothetical protein